METVSLHGNKFVFTSLSRYANKSPKAGVLREATKADIGGHSLMLGGKMYFYQSGAIYSCVLDDAARLFVGRFELQVEKKTTLILYEDGSIRMVYRYGKNKEKVRTHIELHENYEIVFNEAGAIYEIDIGEGI